MTSRHYKFIRRGFDASQLAWEVEDKAGIKLMAYHPKDIVDGYINTAEREIDIFIYGDQPPSVSQAISNIRFNNLPYSPDEEEKLNQIISDHVPLKRMYRGNFSEVVTRYSDSVVRIIVQDKKTKDEKYATGFLYHDFKHLLTAAHVIDPDNYEIEGIEFPKIGMIRANIVDFDNLSDMALLRLAEEIKIAPIRIRYDINIPEHLGTQCIVIGFPDIPGMEPSPSFYELNLVSLKKNYLMNQNLIEVSLPLGSGFSGAPIISMNHSLLGMVLGYPSREDLQNGKLEKISWPKWTSVALPFNYIHEWVERIMH